MDKLVIKGFGVWGCIHAKMRRLAQIIAVVNFMAINPKTVNIYHITHIDNLKNIFESGGLVSDAQIHEKQVVTNPIGYAHIKHRRLFENRVLCFQQGYVGEFVPFYYCPRSPMLFTINKGNGTQPSGCQSSIVHLVSTASVAMQAANWAVCYGNAGAGYLTQNDYSNSPDALDGLAWNIIGSNQWSGDAMHKKQSEFLVKDFFPLGGILQIGCYDQIAVNKVNQLILPSQHRPIVSVQRGWYY